jgi:multisubunit Na+/H+ antiporter MnhB subunit
VSELSAALDLLLGVTLIGLAAASLVTPDRFKAVIFFIAFGLLLTLAWARLNAADVALAEAAIGAGLTGALFLNTLAALRAGQDDGKPAVRTGRGSRLARGLLALLCAGVGGLLAAVVLVTPAAEPELATRAYAELPRSGVENPVTAVLLNFRSYDTLLEVGVLLVAVVGVWSLGAVPEPPQDRTPPGPILLALVRLLVPLIVVVAGYLLWVGTKRPGGAFQAGAILSGAGVLLLLAWRVSPRRVPGWVARAALSAGLLGFLAVGLGVMAVGGRFLEYPAEWAGLLILFIESLLTVSIAITLVALFADEPAGERDAVLEAEQQPGDGAIP